MGNRVMLMLIFRWATMVQGGGLIRIQRSFAVLFGHRVRLDEIIAKTRKESKKQNHKTTTTKKKKKKKEDK